MKKITSYLMIAALSGLFFTSCTRDDESDTVNQDKAVLSFGALLNDMVSNKASLKQAISDIPDCSESTPAFVEVVLSGPNNVGSMDAPLVVSVNPNPGNYDGDTEVEYFTNESSDLELDPGTYTLEFFAVYDGDPALAGTNRIWIAPMAGGSLANFVNRPLPIDIDLGAGVKKYVDVEVLCYDNRVVNEYGYLFFDIEEQRAIEFCVFGNSCDENGRHSAANFRVDVWVYSGSNSSPRGTALFDPEHPYINEVGINEDGDAYANPICFPLPDRPGVVDQYWGEIYVLESGDDEDGGRLVVSGVFTDANVRSLFGAGDTVDYYHFREDCTMGDTGFPQ